MCRKWKNWYQNEVYEEKGSWFQRQGEAKRKEQLVILGADGDVGGRAIKSNEG